MGFIYPMCLHDTFVTHKGVGNIYISFTKQFNEREMSAPTNGKVKVTNTTQTQWL